jgi:hypothetical protein
MHRDNRKCATGVLDVEVAFRALTETTPGSPAQGCSDTRARRACRAEPQHSFACMKNAAAEPVVEAAQRASESFKELQRAAETFRELQRASESLQRTSESSRELPESFRELQGASGASESFKEQLQRTSESFRELQGASESFRDLQRASKSFRELAESFRELQRRLRVRLSSLRVRQARRCSTWGAALCQRRRRLSAHSCLGFRGGSTAGPRWRRVGHGTRCQKFGNGLRATAQGSLG